MLCGAEGPMMEAFKAAHMEGERMCYAKGHHVLFLEED